jgi:hypothetical protein
MILLSGKLTSGKIASSNWVITNPVSRQQLPWTINYYKLKD